MTGSGASGRVRKADRTRARILDAAAESFRARGYGGASLRDIAAAAELQAGSLYYHFGSRDELVIEVLRVGQDTINDAVSGRLAQLPATAGPRERLRAMIDAHSGSVAVPGNYTAAALRLLGTVPPPLRELQIDSARGYGDLWRATILDGQREGVFRGDVDASALRMLIIGALNSVPDWYGGAQSPAAIAGLSDTFGAVFVDGLAARPRLRRGDRPVAPSVAAPRAAEPLSQADRTRSRILESAAAAFREHGLEEAALVDVAAAAGLQRESLYYHFSSREDLAEQLLRMSWERTARSVRETVDALPVNARPERRLETAIAAHVHSVLDPADGAVLHALARLPQEVRQGSLREQRAYVRYWRQLVRAVVAENPVQVRLDASIAALVVVNGLNWSAEWYRPEGRLSASRLAREFAEVIVGGLAVRPSRRG